MRRSHSLSDAGEDPSEVEADQASEPPSLAPPGTAVERISSAIGTVSSSSSTAVAPASVAMFRSSSESSSSSDSSPSSSASSSSSSSEAAAEAAEAASSAVREAEEGLYRWRPNFYPFGRTAGAFTILSEI